MIAKIKLGKARGSRQESGDCFYLFSPHPAPHTPLPDN
ncbi:hypothetical protein BFG60_0838 [Microcystis aeruginosa NIES-98]|nr:hypothetical protein BFG60_0838 [Microcystis aeruginosa NIES-98]